MTMNRDGFLANNIDDDRGDMLDWNSLGLTSVKETF